MRRALVVLAIWLAGVASAGLGLATAGGWYEYHWFVDPHDDAKIVDRINREGWEFVPSITDESLQVRYERRPRIVGWLRGGP